MRNHVKELSDDYLPPKGYYNQISKNITKRVR